MKAESIEILKELGHSIAVSELSACAAWFDQGVALLAADEKMGRSVYGREVSRGFSYAGFVGSPSKEHIFNLRYTTKALMDAGVQTSRDVYGCIFTWALHIARHFRAGRLTSLQVRELLRAICAHHRNTDISFSQLKDVSGLVKIKKQFDLDRFEHV
jgi:hypothetical protein